MEDILLPVNNKTTLQLQLQNKVKDQPNNFTLHNNLSPDGSLAIHLPLKCSHVIITITIVYFRMRHNNFLG